MMVADALPAALGVQQETFSLSTAKCPDIHDANRKKIEISLSKIRPRCKEYAQKQRSIRTLACFAAGPKLEGVDSATQVSTVTAESDATANTKVPLSTPAKGKNLKKVIPKAPRALVVASGRVEKPPRVHPQRAVPSSDAPQRAKICGCSTPAECFGCTMRRLAEQFTAIVNARKERLRQEAEGVIFLS